MSLWPFDKFFQSPSESELQAKNGRDRGVSVTFLKPLWLVSKNSAYHWTWTLKGIFKLLFLVLEKGGSLLEIHAIYIAALFFLIPVVFWDSKMKDLREKKYDNYCSCSQIIQNTFVHASFTMSLWIISNVLDTVRFWDLQEEKYSSCLLGTQIWVGSGGKQG